MPQANRCMSVIIRFGSGTKEME
uniref:Uncharacterized protein n=1 Tax=Rhizophora mucronata TaxID=61149 RepID=A0A2P2IMG8_RHIMU